MYITDKDKLHRRRIILVLYAAVLLLVMLLCLHRVDTVCKQQLDTLNQIVEVRQEIDLLFLPQSMATETPEPKLSSTDYDLICRVVAAEARGEGYEGQLAVAQCIRDRAVLWGMTPADVVTAPGQFAKPYQGETGSDIQAAVNDCFAQGARVFDGPVTHFCEARVTPYWAEGKELVGVLGNHRFYR